MIRVIDEDESKINLELCYSLYLMLSSFTSLDERVKGTEKSTSQEASAETSQNETMSSRMEQKQRSSLYLYCWEVLRLAAGERQEIDKNHNLCSELYNVVCYCPAQFPCSAHHPSIPDGLVVRISACHADGRGSIPRQGAWNGLLFASFCLIL